MLKNKILNWRIWYGKLLSKIFTGGRFEVFETDSDLEKWLLENQEAEPTLFLVKNSDGRNEWNADTPEWKERRRQFKEQLKPRPDPYRPT